MFRLLLVLFLWSGILPDAHAVVQPKRVALVIGNSAYESSALRNPVNDARLIGKALEKIDFEVLLVLNASKKEMTSMIRAFYEKLSPLDIGFFYYAGHAIEYDGKNYMIPVDTNLALKPFEVQDDLIDARRVIRAMEEAGNRINVVALDACRNNPFVGESRASSGGLSKMTWKNTGMYVGFSTAPGEVATDGAGENTLYATTLAESLLSPDLEIEDVFKRVRRTVSKASGQIPWGFSTIDAPYYLNPVDMKKEQAKAEQILLEQQIIKEQEDQAAREKAKLIAIEAERKAAEEKAQFAEFLAYKKQQEKAERKAEASQQAFAIEQEEKRVEAERVAIEAAMQQEKRKLENEQRIILAQEAQRNAAAEKERANQQARAEAEEQRILAEEIAALQAKHEKEQKIKLAKENKRAEEAKLASVAEKRHALQVKIDQEENQKKRRQVLAAQKEKERLTALVLARAAAQKEKDRLEKQTLTRTAQKEQDRLAKLVLARAAEQEDRERRQRLLASCQQSAKRDDMKQALRCYQRVLAEKPGYPAAIKGVQDIVVYYEKSLAAALKKKQLVTAKNSYALLDELDRPRAGKYRKKIQKLEKKLKRKKVRMIPTF